MCVGAEKLYAVFFLVNIDNNANMMAHTMSDSYNGSR